MKRAPGEVFERDGEMHVQTDIESIAVQVTQRTALNTIRASDCSEQYVDVALDAWEMSPTLSAQLRPFIPSSRDLTMELRRYLPAGVELVNDTSYLGQRCVHPDGSLWEREKFYMRTYIDGEHIAALRRGYDITDRVRSAFFAAAKFLGERLAKHVDLVRAKRKSPNLPISIRFLTKDAIRMMGEDKEAFAAFDHTTDSAVVPLASYFVVMPS